MCRKEREIPNVVGKPKENFKSYRRAHINEILKDVWN